MDRRAFVGLSLAATGGVFVPKFSRWFPRLRDDSGWVQAAIDRGEWVYGERLIFRKPIIFKPSTSGGLMSCMIEARNLPYVARIDWPPHPAMGFRDNIVSMSPRV